MRTTTKNSTTTVSTETIKISTSPRIVTLSRNLPNDYYSEKKFGNHAYRKSVSLTIMSLVIKINQDFNLLFEYHQFKRLD